VHNARESIGEGFDNDAPASRRRKERKRPGMNGLLNV
jgi:hypothetical protein